MLQEWHADYSLVEFGKGWNLIGQLVNKALKLLMIFCTMCLQKQAGSAFIEYKFRYTKYITPNKR